MTGARPDAPRRAPCYRCVQTLGPTGAFKPPAHLRQEFGYKLQRDLTRVYVHNPLGWV
jgi:hypothetical protein